MGKEQTGVCAFHEIAGGQIADHEERIRTLEKISAKSHEQITHLIKKMDDLMGVIKAFVVTIISGMLAAGFGFIIWYIQSLPR